MSHIHNLINLIRRTMNDNTVKLFSTKPESKLN